MYVFEPAFSSSSKLLLDIVNWSLLLLKGTEPESSSCGERRRYLSQDSMMQIILATIAQNLATTKVFSAISKLVHCPLEIRYGYDAPNV